MADNQQHAQPPPVPVFADEIPECFFRHVGIPNDEILREFGVGGQQCESQQQDAEEIKIARLQHRFQHALPQENHRDDIDRG